MSDEKYLQKTRVVFGLPYFFLLGARCLAERGRRVPKQVQNEVGEFKNTGLSLAHLLYSVQLVSLSSFILSPSHENRTALENESPAEKRHGIGERVRTTPAFSPNGKYFSSLIYEDNI